MSKGKVINSQVFKCVYFNKIKVTERFFKIMVCLINITWILLNIDRYSRIILAKSVTISSNYSPWITHHFYENAYKDVINLCD